MIRSSLRKYGLILSLPLIITLIFSCSADKLRPETSWSEWRGPGALGRWETAFRADTLTPGNIQKLWEVPVGTGYSGPTVADGRVYLMDFHGNDKKYERIRCFDAGTGEEIWTHAYECNYIVGYPTGPRASVLIDGNRAYSLGTMGDLYCFDAVSGEVIWYVDGEVAYNISFPIWGLASSPMVVDDLLIVQLGGTPGACIVAFDKKNGDEAWSALSDHASYVTPILIEQGKKDVLVCWTGDNVAGLDPGTGEVYWKIPYERRKSVINISTPVVEMPWLFLSSFYDGSMLIRLDEKDAEASLEWVITGESERNTSALHSIISTPMIDSGYVYGIDSYGEFRCLELPTGERVWTDSTLVPYGRWANAHLVSQADKIWAFNELGELVMGKVSPAGFTDMGRVQLIEPVPVSPNPRGGVNWAHPAFKGDRIFARSDALLAAFKLNS